MEQDSFREMNQEFKSTTYFSEELASIVKNKSRNDELVSVLKQSDIFNFLDNSGNTLLHIAAECGNKNAAKFLIESGSNIDVQNNMGKTPLIVAMEHNQQITTDILIEANANVFISDNSGRNALHYILIAKWIYDISCFFNKFLKKVESQCLCNNELIATKLRDAGWSLPRVVLLGNINVTKLMLDFGCQVDARESIYGRTSLHEAVLSSDIQCVKLLLDYNADPNAMDRFHRPPLYYVYDRNKTHSDEHLEIIKLLIGKGALLITSVDNSSRSQVDLALRYGNREVIEILLQANLDLTRKHEEDNTPAHIIAINKNPDALKPLEHQNFDVNARNSFLETPLWVAASHGNARAVEFLLKRDADVNVVNGDYCSPLYACIDQFSSEYEAQCKECVQLLLEYGADVELEVPSYIFRHPRGNSSTVFDVVQEEEMYFIGELLIAHAVLREVKGTPLADFIYRQIRSHPAFKTYYDFCNQQLAIKLHKSVTLLNLLCENDRKFERYARDRQFDLCIENFNKDWTSNSYYFNAILQKRYAKAVYMLRLREEASILICKIMKTDYFQYPSIIDEIVSYLDEADLRNFLQIEL